MPKHFHKALKWVALQSQKRRRIGVFSLRRGKSEMLAEQSPLRSMTFFSGSSTSGAWFSHSLNVAAALQSPRVIHTSHAERALCWIPARAAVSSLRGEAAQGCPNACLQLSEEFLRRPSDLLDLEVQTWKPERGRMPRRQWRGWVLRGQTAGGWPRGDDKWGTRCPAHPGALLAQAEVTEVIHARGRLPASSAALSRKKWQPFVAGEVCGDS